MRISIDARFLTHPQAGGFKTYTWNLVDALSKVDKDNDYLIYVDRNPCSLDLPRQRNITYEVVEGTFPGFGVPFREQVKLRKRIYRDNPDVVHFLCNTAPVGLSCKYVVTLHDTIQLTSREPIISTSRPADFRHWATSSYSRWTIRNAVMSARKIITVSHSEKTQIARHLNIAPERVCVTHLAPNPTFKVASVGQRSGWYRELGSKYGLKSRFVFCVGYEPRKNIPFVMDVTSRLAKEYRDLSLVVVAAEEKQRRIFQQMAVEKAPDLQTIILGNTPLDELAALYNLATVFVFPSEREGFGLPPLEAIACGTPTIAMNKSSLPEILQNGALLVDDLSLESWTNAIRRVLSSQRLRSDLTCQGLRRAAELTWEQCAQQTIDVYHTVVEEKTDP